MNLKPPTKILVTTDDNILEFVNIIKKSVRVPEQLFVYKFSKSITKMNSTMTLTENELRRCLTNTLKII